MARRQERQMRLPKEVLSTGVLTQTKGALTYLHKAGKKEETGQRKLNIRIRIGKYTNKRTKRCSATNQAKMAHIGA